VILPVYTIPPNPHTVCHHSDENFVHVTACDVGAVWAFSIFVFVRGESKFVRNAFIESLKTIEIIVFAYTIACESKNACLRRTDCRIAYGNNKYSYV
jgi:hypothetical protein